MKKHLLYLLALSFFGVGSTFAQNEIVVGDMNADGQLTVGDVTALSETVVGRQAVRRIAVGGNPYAADNSGIVGRWSGSKGSLTFNADGTTDYKDGYTYEYLPAQCMVMFYDANGDAVKSLEVMTLSSNKLVLANVSLTEYYTYGDRIKVVVGEDGVTYYEDANGHRYVDLGLPSGTLWATTNVGASEPEDYGYYFAWGEVEPKSTYNWSTLKYCLDSNGNKFSKYVASSSYGTVDNKTELDLEDDAAYMNWGEGWRMPSLEQIQELYNSNYVKAEWVTQNGKSGRLITSKTNGASLFLPAAGCRYEGSLYTAGSVGYYWSRSLSTSGSDLAYFLRFDSSGLDWGNGCRNDCRCLGFSVRPVRVSGSE